MSYASEGYLEDFEAIPATMPVDSVFPLPRSKFIPLPFILPTLICLVSWMAGGVPMLTDFGFLMLTAICVFYVIVEVVKFPQRYGIGGFVLFGGVLVWFCHDYCSNWLAYDFNCPGAFFHRDLIARTACYYCLFVGVMSIGLLIPKGQWLVKLILRAPEPSSPKVYLGIWIMLLVIGLLPFALFTTDGFFTSVINNAFGNFLGTTVIWTVGRSGNFNYNWGAYVAQVIEIGEFSSLFGLFYGIFISRSKVIKTLTWINWAYWLCALFQTGRRGEVAAAAIPAIGFLYLKLQLRAAQKSGRPKQSIVAYVIVAILIFGTLFVVQYQGYFRGEGLNSTDFSQFDLFKNQGNAMFSEALRGFELVPSQHPFFRDTIPGEGAILALPETFAWFCIGPCPRALWVTKPVDPAMVWYNAVITGSEGVEGTTVSQGLVGHWYFRYGLIGMIEGALLVGWLMGIAERVLQGSGEKPLGILYSMVLMAWLFRIYRNFYFQELYGPMIGAAAFAVLVTMISPLSTQKE